MMEFGLLGQVPRKLHGATSVLLSGLKKFATVALVVTCSHLLIAQQATSVPAKGDSSALQVVQLALNALSGTSSWSNVQASHFIGTISTPANTGVSTSQIEWEDIWQQRNIWSLHKTGTGTTERDLIQSPSQVRTLRRGDKTTLTVGAAATLPPVEIPGALLATVLNDPTCSAQSVPREQVDGANSNESYFVRIICTVSANPGVGESQLWAFSSATRLPVSVRVNQPDLRRAGANIVETVYFTHYRVVGGLTVPDSCKLVNGMLTRVVNLQTVEFTTPNQFSAADFEVSK